MQFGGQSVMMYQTFRCLIKSIAEKYRDDPDTAIKKQQQLTRKFKEQHPNWQEEIMMSGTPLPTPKHLQTESARMNFVSPFLRNLQLSQTRTPVVTPHSAQSQQNNFWVPDSQIRTPIVTPRPNFRVPESQSSEMHTPRPAAAKPQTPSTGFKTPRKSNPTSKCSTPFSPMQIPLPTWKTKRIEEFFVKVPRRLEFENVLKDVEMEETPVPEPEEVMDTSEPIVEDPMQQDEVPEAEETSPMPEQVEVPANDVSTPEKIQESPKAASPQITKQKSPVSIQELLRQALPNLNFENVQPPVVHRRSSVTSFSFGAASFTIPTLPEELPEEEPVLPVNEDSEVIVLDEENHESIKKVAQRGNRANRRFGVEPSPEFNCSMSFKDFMEQRSQMRKPAPEPRPSCFESPAMQNFYKDFTPSSQQLDNAHKKLAEKLERMRNLCGRTTPPLEKRKRLFSDGSRLSQNSATPVLDEDVHNFGQPEAMGELDAAASPFTPRKSYWTQANYEVAALPQETAKETFD